MTLQVVSAPKDYTFQLRMNSQIKSELEQIFAKCGITLPDAFNIFMQQVLNEGGFPFPIVPDQTEFKKKAALLYLTASYREGMASSDDGKNLIPADEVERMLEEM